MSLPRTAADVLQNHTTLEVESLDRICLKVIQMRLQDCSGIAWFFRRHRGEAFATAKVMAEMTRPFVSAIEKFALTNAIPLMTFTRGQRKDDMAQQALADFPDREGILFIGKAQEKAYVVRTITSQLEKRGIKYEPLDNGILSCEDPKRLQKICYEVTDSGQRMALFWLGSLSHTIRPLATTLSDETGQQQILNVLRKTLQKHATFLAAAKT